MVALAREKQLTVKAASLAFYAFNFFVGLFVLIYAAFTLFGTEQVLAVPLHALTGVDAGELQRLFERIGSTPTGRRRTTVGLAVVISSWSALRLFRAVEGIFAEVYGIRKERSLRSRLFESLLVQVVVTVTTVVMVGIGAAFLFRTAGWQWTVFGPFVLWASLVVLFLPLYYTFSGDASLSEVLPGTALAAAGWTVSAIGLRLYVGVSESVELYGVVGAVMLILTWVYVVALSVMLGVLLNALLAGEIEPSEEWYPFGEE
jgi:membrane protein